MAANRQTTLAEIFLFLIMLGLATAVPLEASALVMDSFVTRIVSQMKSYSSAMATFQDAYHGLPGDLRDAGKYLKGCTGEQGSDCNPFSPGAGNGIIGDPKFPKTWKSQVTANTSVPAKSDADETILFWGHLLLANLIGGVDGSGFKNGTPVAWGKTHPATIFTDSGFIVGHADGSQMPTALSPKMEGINGTVLMLVTTAELNGKIGLDEPGKQPLTAWRAASIDRKMDDGRPETGYVRIFGTPACFNLNDMRQTEPLDRFLYWIEGKETDPRDPGEKNCGIVARIGD